MRRSLLFFILLSFCISINSQTIDLHGEVTNQDGQPIEDAIVTLVGQELKDTTGPDGSYEIKQTEVTIFKELQPEYRNFIVERNNLVFSLPDATPLKIELFDVQGILLKRESMPNVPNGFYRFNISENAGAAKVLIIRVAIGTDTKTFRYLPLRNGNHTFNRITGGSTPVTGSGLMKLAAIDDTLKITAEGYKEKSEPIISYEQELDITLEPESSISDTGRSLGCGKTLGDINKSGTYTIQSSGKNRTYIVKFPNDYDKTNPYRLIFAMHCMGASAQDIGGNNPRGDGAYNYYRLGSIAENAILVAPQGNSNGTWNGEEDHKFFDDMLDLFKETLCIDTNRVFACGFSFGAMFSYSLSTNHQQQLRAVATYAPANYNIWLPENKHLPLAYMTTTGMSDGTCPWDQGGRGGKYCAIGHAEDNGCEDPTNVPAWNNNGQYLVHDYEGCDEGYPVKVVTFGGGHTAGESWMPQMTWDFFKQF